MNIIFHRITAIAAVFIHLPFTAMPQQKATWPAMRQVTDMAGRNVTIPVIISSVYSTSPMGEILMYTLAPHMIAGTTWDLDSASRTLLLPVYNDKPLLGGWYGKNTTANPEVILKARPDIVLTMGEMTTADISQAHRLQEKLGITVVMIDGQLSALDDTYRFMGGILGDCSSRADTLADYCRRTLDTIDAVIARIPENKRIRCYYAEGFDGLQTDPSGSSHAEVLVYGGADNVARVPRTGGYGRASVSIEQILVWNPELIFVGIDRGHEGGTGNYLRLLDDSRWRLVPAVSAGNVYQIPSLPFNWIDRPPSVNRIIGLRWITSLLYPEWYHIDIRTETRTFYRLFYHREMSERDCAMVLEHALPLTKNDEYQPERGE